MHFSLQGASALLIAAITAGGLMTPSIPDLEKHAKISFDKSDIRIDETQNISDDHVLVITNLKTGSDKIEAQESVKDTGILFETKEYSVWNAVLEDGFTVKDALEDLNEEDFVLYAEPDSCLKVNNGDGTYDFDSGYQWHHKAIHTYEAWQQLDNLPSRTKVRVGIIDGVFQLQDNELWAAVNMTYSADFSTGEKKSVDWYSAKADHANMCAGIIAARSTDGNNISGVASGSKSNLVDLVCLSVYKDNNTDVLNSALASAITYAADVNCKVTSLSLGLYGSSSKLKTVELAVDYAYEKGMILVVASGNTGGKVYECPAYMENVVTVGNLRVDSNGALVREYTSSYGNIDLSAPGTDILTIDAHGSSAVVAGTSFAAPMVAGAMSLVMSVDSRIKPSEALDILISTAVDVGASGYDQYTGYGCIDCYAAVRKAVQKYKPSYLIDITIKSEKLEETIDNDSVRTSSIVTLFKNEILGTGTSNYSQAEAQKYLEGRVSVCDHFDRIFKSQAFWQKSLQISDDEFIKMVYQVVLGRTPTSTELAQGRSWISNYSRAHMIGKFMRLSTTKAAIKELYPRVKFGNYSERKYFWNCYF